MLLSESAAEYASSGLRDVGLGHDLQQRYPGAVEIDVAGGPAFGMYKLAGVLFHVDAGYIDAPGFPVNDNLHRAFGRDGILS